MSTGFEETAKAKAAQLSVALFEIEEEIPRRKGELLAALTLTRNHFRDLLNMAKEGFTWPTLAEVAAAVQYDARRGIVHETEVLGVRLAELGEITEARQGSRRPL